MSNKDNTRANLVKLLEEKNDLGVFNNFFFDWSIAQTKIEKMILKNRKAILDVVKGFGNASDKIDMKQLDHKEGVPPTICIYITNIAGALTATLEVESGKVVCFNA